MEPKVTTRMYNPETGELINSDLDLISFGAIAPESKSKIIVMDAVISGVVSAGGLGIGIMSSGLAQPLFNGTILYDILNDPKITKEPQTPFSGVIDKEIQGNIINVGFREKLISKYVAIMIQAPSMPIDCGCVILKWCFGFDKRVV